MPPSIDSSCRSAVELLPFCLKVFVHRELTGAGCSVLVLLVCRPVLWFTFSEPEVQPLKAQDEKSQLLVGCSAQIAVSCVLTFPLVTLVVLRSGLFAR
jgi:hypothetical protein